MDSESLKERKRQLGKESYKKVKISQVRAAAVMKRKDRVSQAGDGDSSDEESEEVGDSCEEESEVEAEGPNRRQYHSRTVTRKKKEFFTMLPTSYIFQLKVLKKLVGDFGIGKLSVGEDKNTNEDAPKSTLYRYISKIRNFLISCKRGFNLDPTDLLLPWAKLLASESEKVFFSTGISFVDPCDVPKEIRLKKIFDNVGVLKFSKIGRTLTKKN